MSNSYRYSTKAWESLSILKYGTYLFHKVKTHCMHNLQTKSISSEIFWFLFLGSPAWPRATHKHHIFQWVLDCILCCNFDRFIKRVGQMNVIRFKNALNYNVRVHAVHNIIIHYDCVYTLYHTYSFRISSHNIFDRLMNVNCSWNKKSVR